MGKWALSRMSERLKRAGRCALVEHDGSKLKRQDSQTVQLASATYQVETSVRYRRHHVKTFKRNNLKHKTYTILRIESLSLMEWRHFLHWATDEWTYKLQESSQEG